MTLDEVCQVTITCRANVNILIEETFATTSQRELDLERFRLASGTRPRS